jgi:hypothetical protein
MALLKLVQASALPAVIAPKDQEAWLKSFLPRLGANLVRQSVAGLGTFLPPTGHVARNWSLTLKTICHRLAERNGHIILKDAGRMNYYRVDFAASAMRCLEGGEVQRAENSPMNEEQLTLQ